MEYLIKMSLTEFVSSNVVNDFAPIPLGIWAAILSGLSITLFFILFSHAPFRISRYWLRFGASIGAGIIVWMVLFFINHAFLIQWKVDNWLDLCAGMLIYITAIFCNYYLCNVGGGFRIEMLVNIANLEREITLDEWMALYGKGLGMRYFLDDRLKSTLLSWKMVTQNGERITITRFGTFIGRIATFLAGFFYAE